MAFFIIEGVSMKSYKEFSSIQLCVNPIDFRRGIFSLASAVEGEFSEPPFSGGLFLFTNKTKKNIRALYWDKTGLPEEFRINFASLFNENLRLKEENNSLKRTIFSQKSERYAIQDYILPMNSLFDEVEQIISAIKNTDDEKDNSASREESDKKPDNKPTKKGGKKPFPENLPRETKIHDLPEEEKICKYDNTPLVAIGEDVVEKLTVVPMTMKVIQHHYLKYACPCCQQNVVKAKAELSIIPASMAEPSLIAHIAMHKYFFALPLYRQEVLFSQKDIEIPRITLARWMIAAGNAVLPIVQEIKKYILSQQAIHCDETTVQVLKEKGKSPTAKSYMWVLASCLEAKPAVVFQYYPNRSAESANDFLEGFKGILHADGYDGYNEICNLPNVTRVGCWAHARRKFESAFKDGAPAGKLLAEEFLKEIKKLFLIEREVIPLLLEERVKIRQEKSAPVILSIRKLIDDNVLKIFPRSKLGMAFGYISNEWNYLIEFLNHGLISLSNNRIENLVRPFAIGRKNWLFSNSTYGAEASAALYSLIGTAKENGLHIEDYLEDVFTQLPYLEKQNNPSYESLLPWNWKKDSATNTIQ